MTKTIVTETETAQTVIYPTGVLTTISVINYVNGIINFLLCTRFVLKLFGANAGTPIVRFIYDLTNFLLQPFRGIFPATAEGRAVFEPTTIVAIVFYSIILYGIAQLVLTLTQESET